MECIYALYFMLIFCAMKEILEKNIRRKLLMIVKFQAFYHPKICIENTL